MALQIVDRLRENKRKNKTKKKKLLTRENSFIQPFVNSQMVGYSRLLQIVL